MLSVFLQKDHRRKELYMNVQNDVDALIDLGMSEQDIAHAINDLDCMNRDRDDSCAAAAAAAPAIFDDDDMVRK